MDDVYFDATCDRCGHDQDVTSVVAGAVAPVLAALIDARERGWARRNKVARSRRRRYARKGH